MTRDYEHNYSKLREAVQVPLIRERFTGDVPVLLPVGTEHLRCVKDLERCKAIPVQISEVGNGTEQSGTGVLWGTETVGNGSELVRGPQEQLTNSVLSGR